MNIKKLKLLEKNFFTMYPGGFSDPALAGIGKKHKMSQMVEKTQASFRKSAFRDSDQVMEDMISLTSRSSMVSLFEKPKYRDTLRAFSPSEREQWVDAFRKRLHGNRAKGFSEMTQLLMGYKLAKWSLVSILPLYFRPDEEVFVKPTTAKKVLEFLEIEDIVYKPQPSWEFYDRFQQHIESMKAAVDSGLSPNNAAFTGFLMMTINEISER